MNLNKSFFQSNWLRVGPLPSHMALPVVLYHRHHMVPGPDPFYRLFLNADWQDQSH